MNRIRINKDEITARQDRGHSVIAYLLIGLQRTHIDTICHNDTFIAKLLAKPTINNRLRRARQILVIDSGNLNMAHHEHIAIRRRLCNKTFKDGYIIIAKIRFRLISRSKGRIP